MPNRISEASDARALLSAQTELRAEHARVRHLAHDDPRRVAYGERLKAQRRRIQQVLEVRRAEAPGASAHRRNRDDVQQTTRDDPRSAITRDS